MNTIYHKKEVQIAGEKITAEYFETNIDLLDTNKWELDGYGFWDNLWDMLTLPFYKLKHKVKHIYWEIRYGFQRAFKGYDNTDLYSLDYKFIDRYYKILTEFKKSLHGHPGRMSEEEWNAIIDKMLLHLYYMDEENIEKELDKDVPENWIATWNTSSAIMEKHKNEFFKLFSEYFYDLWD